MTEKTNGNTGWGFLASFASNAASAGTAYLKGQLVDKHQPSEFDTTTVTGGEAGGSGPLPALAARAGMSPLALVLLAAGAGVVFFALKK